MKLFPFAVLIALVFSSTEKPKLHGRGLEERPKSEVMEIVATPQADTDPDLSCNYEIMRSYGLKGNPSPKTTPHKYCPSISNNCCTSEDAELSFEAWNTDTRFKIERYYQLYNFAIRYFMGYTAEVYLLAREYSLNPHLECKRAANDYMSMNLNPSMSVHIADTIHNAVDKMADVRRGFYCSVCDARVQSYFKDFYDTTNLESFTKLYYSKDFCLTLVEETIEASFYVVTYLNRYLNNAVTLMNCKTGASTKPQLELTGFSTEDVKNCFFFKSRYFFFFCTSYCKHFNLVKASPAMDGDVQALRPFIEFFSKYRKESFEYPKNNFLADGVTFEENFLMDMYAEILRDVVFFRAGAQQTVFLDQYETDISLYEGINIYPPLKGSRYPLVILGSAERILTLVAILLALV